jgi:hypothetical protein
MQQMDFIERIDTPDLPSNEIRILEGDLYILLRNMDTRSGLAKGGRCRAVQLRNRTVVLEFDDGETRTRTRIPMEEKGSNGMQFVTCQLPLRLIFAGTVHKSQGMTLQRSVIDCRTKFWEHGQLYVALSRVKSPADLCILLPDDTDDFTIGPLVDADVLQIVESMSSSGAPPIAPPLLADSMQPELSSFDGSGTTQSHELLCPDDHLAAPEDETESPPRVEYDAAENMHSQPVDRPRNIDIITGILQDQHVLRLNCLGHGLPEIIPFTDPVPMAAVPHRALETCDENVFLTSVF